MIKITLELTGTANCNDVCAEIFLDQQLVGNYSCSTQPYTLDLLMPDHWASHSLKISMTGKNHQHTVIAADGTIESDVSISVSRLEFEEINMLPIFCQGMRCYHHNFNDPSRIIELDEFYGYIGCNGDVNIEFETPLYLWFNKHF